MKRKLTDSVVRGLPLPATDRVDVWDLVLPALGLRLAATGRRTWVVAVRPSGEKHPRRIRLGHFPTMGTAAARAAARAMMSGDTPAPTPRGSTFGALVEQFLAHGRDRRGRPVRPGTVRAYRYALQQVAAGWGARPVTKLRRADVAALLHAAATERGAPAAALTRKALARFCSWCIEIGVLEHNPAAGAPLYAHTPGSRVLDDAELKAVWGPGVENDTFRSILRLCLLLGLRRGEAGGLRRSEINGDTLLIPAARRKAGGDLRLPLPQMAMAEIRRQPVILGRDPMFGNNSDFGWTDWVGGKRRLDRELSLSHPWRTHDLRRTTRTRLHELGVPHEVVVRILGHGLDPLSRAYDHSDYLTRMREALEGWATEVERIVTLPGGEVVNAIECAR